MSLLYTTLVYDQGHHLAFPIDPDYHRPLISHITLTTPPLILDAVGAALPPLWLGEFPKNVGLDFGSEGVESEEISGLPSEEVEVSEQPSEGMLGEGLEWKEHAVVLGTTGRGSE